jgi:hypothetical protein
MASCGGCSHEEETIQVGSSTIVLDAGKSSQNVVPAGPRVRVINVGPSKDITDAPYGDTSIPTEVTPDTALTNRLKERLDQAFAARGGTPPNIEIYTGVLNLDAFAKYYEDRGFKIQRASIPASQVIAPILDEKPELSGKINLSNYAGVSINQVVVEGANISAADKYIDPETYEIIYKTFVTVNKNK